MMDGFRIGQVQSFSSEHDCCLLTYHSRITQEPHKHAHYVSLLCAISHRQSSTDNGNGSESPEAKVGQKRKAENGSEEVDCSSEILEDLVKAFKTWVQGREWLNMRLCVSDFSDLALGV